MSEHGEHEHWVPEFDPMSMRAANCPFCPNGENSPFSITFSLEVEEGELGVHTMVDAGGMAITLPGGETAHFDADQALWIAEALIYNSIVLRSTDSYKSEKVTEWTTEVFEGDDIGRE